MSIIVKPWHMVPFLPRHMICCDSDSQVTEKQGYRQNSTQPQNSYQVSLVKYNARTTDFTCEARTAYKLDAHKRVPLVLFTFLKEWHDSSWSFSETTAPGSFLIM